MASPDFARAVVDLVAKRAAYICSNPDCGVSTTGANSDPIKSTTVGEAAHIFGARSGTARYRPEMSDYERSNAINAIWLCGNCHSQIDKDSYQFSVELLYLWKIGQETSTRDSIGKPGDVLRRKLTDEEQQHFVGLPIYARQIIAEKPKFWEYLLTAELMEFYLIPAWQKKSELESSLYTLPQKFLDEKSYLSWMQVKLSETARNAQTSKNVLSNFQTAWGAPGTPGSVHKIVRNCQLFANIACRFVEIAEEAKFTSCPEEFDETNQIFINGVLHPVSAFRDFPAKFRALMESVESVGSYSLELLISLPNGWEDEIQVALELATPTYLKRFIPS